MSIRPPAERSFGVSSRAALTVALALVLAAGACAGGRPSSRPATPSTAGAAGAAGATTARVKSAAQSTPSPRDTSRGVRMPAPPAAFDTLHAVMQPEDTIGAGASQLSPSQLVMQAYREGMAAYRAGNYAGYKAAMERAVTLEPGHPILMYHLARGCALLGQAEAALGWLDRMAGTGVVVDIAANADLASLRDSTAFKAVAAKLDSNRVAEGSADVAWRIRQPDLMPEGIAYDPGTVSFLVSSIYLRKIVRVASDGTVTDFIAPAQDGFWCGVGLKADPRRRLLWACSGASEMMRGASPADTSRTGLFAFDLDSGETRGKYVVPDSTVKRFLNDLVLAANGDIYATDSDHGDIWRLPADGTALEPFIDDDRLVGSNGITFSDDGRLLYVSEYPLGISVIDVATRRIRRIEHLDVLATAYVDGLYCHGNSLIAIQNAQGLSRVIRFYLDPTGLKINGASILASHLEQFDEPTTGVLVNEEIYFIANSELNRFGPDGKLKPLEPPQDFLIMRARY